MTALNPTQKFWLQAGGVFFALTVALWGLRDMPGGEMIGTFASYASAPHQRVLARQVAAVMHDPTSGPQTGWSSQRPLLLRAAVPRPAGETAGPLPFAPAVTAGRPELRVAAIGFLPHQHASGPDRTEAPALPPPKSQS